MAYRQLFFLACVSLGFGLVGCGGESASSAVDPTTDDSAPGNPDAPPSGADDSPPNSDDPAPRNADAPRSPGGSGDGDSGGNAEALCRELCDILRVTECPQGQTAGALCQTDCVIPPALQPCASAYAAAISCMLSADTLCVSDDEPGNPFEECADEFYAADACEEQYEPPDPDPDPDPDPVENCTLAGGCSCGDDLCAQCECAAGAQAATACATICEQ